MTEILYDARWVGNHGIGRFAGEIQKLIHGLTPFQAKRRPWHPLDPFLMGATLWLRRPKLFFSPGCIPPVGWPGQFVFTLHDLHHLHVPEDSSAAKRAFYQYIIRPACHRAEFVLTVSQYSKNEICRWASVSEEKVINVGNGVGLPFASTGTKYDPGFPYLLYVGSRKPHKNLPRLLEAFARSGVSKEIRLILSGQPDEPISSVLEQLHLKEEVVFMDLTDDSLLADVYRGAHAFLFPSLYEGFGLPPVEAMACGIPVLSSNVCSLPEIIGNGGLLVDPLDIEAIADGILKLVYDSGLRENLRSKALMRVKKFSWPETARKVIDVLQIAGAGPGRVSVSCNA
jgi:glycosyltransferase involved in cell wall biosynthesis